MTNVEKLLAIEDIKQLKARYCRAIDKKQWQEWRNVFATDAVILMPEGTNPPHVAGIDAIIEMVSTILEGAITVHHLHAPELTIIGETEATGIWAMEDNLYWPTEKPNFFGAKHHYHGTGHYYEKYRKTPDGWRITEMAIPRLYEAADGVFISRGM